MSVVGIRKLGYSAAPWKKNSKAGKPDVAPKKLFDDPQMAEFERERTISSVKAYSFTREGKADKGLRLDHLSSVVAVGQTLHFTLHDFLYEKKSKGENVFPDGISVIEPFSMVELTILSSAEEQATNGYGLNIACVRPLPFTLYSCLTPLNKTLLLNTFDKLQQDMVEKAKETCLTIRSVLEQANVGYLAHVSPKSYVVPSDVDGVYKLTCDEESVIAGVQTVDIIKTDLLHFTNAGENDKYASLLLEIAAAAGCLYCWVFRNEYYTRYTYFYWLFFLYIQKLIYMYIYKQQSKQGPFGVPRRSADRHRRLPGLH